MIYDKRRALIEYIAFYSASSTDAVDKNRVQDDGLDVRELCSQHSDDDDDGQRRSTTPVSGSSSPISGRSTPANSDDGIDDVVPITYEPVKSVSVVRQRTKPASTQSGLCNVMI